MDEFLSFRKFITPAFIQIIFWIFAALAVLAGLITMFRGGINIIAGPIFAIVGVFIARIYCELLILLFRIYDELVAIRTGKPPVQGFEVSMPFATAGPDASAAVPPSA